MNNKFAEKPMKATCPKCETLIPAAQMNVATDVAVCPTCSEVFPMSSIVETQEVPPEFDINDPPGGAWFYDDFRSWRIGASTRNSMAIFLVPFMCVWSGLSLGGIYGRQLEKGEFDLGASLFGIPFILGTLLFGGLVMMTVCGRIDLIVTDSAGKLFIGVGPFGWTRRFDWSEVTKIDEEVLGHEYSGSSNQVVILLGKKRLKFGSMMSDTRRYYLLQGLRVLRQRA